MVNTTRSVRTEVPKGTVEEIPHDDAEVRVLNTTRIYDDAEALDENEIVHIVPANGVVAIYEDGSAEHLVVWVVYEDLTTRGVGLTESRLDLEQDAESKEGFIRYERINNG